MQLVKKNKFLAIVSVFAFLISLEYGITKPAAVSFFLANYGASNIPYAWILTVPLNLALVCLYNRLLSKWGCLKTFLSTVVLTIAINSFSACFLKIWPWVSFFQYIWKDLYILLMFKQLWSLIHTTVSTKKASYVYGLLFGFGGFGSVIGGLVSGFFAVKLSSERLFLFTIIIYFLLFFIYVQAKKASNLSEEKELASKASFSLIKNSNFLKLVLFLVVFMQMSVAFVDYQFSYILERTISNLDLRTEYTGRIMSITNSISTAFQLFGGLFFVNFIGLKRSHLFVPIYLLTNSIILFFRPTFFVGSYAYTMIKSIDFSLFGIIREMLYIPMSLNEKYKAKVIIDVFAYRTAKAFSSLFLLFIQFFIHKHILQFVGIISWVTYFTWITIIFLMFKFYQERVIKVES